MCDSETLARPMKYKCLLSPPQLQQEGTAVHPRGENSEKAGFLYVLRGLRGALEKQEWRMGSLDGESMESRSPQRYFQHSSTPSQQGRSQVKKVDTDL